MKKYLLTAIISLVLIISLSTVASAKSVITENNKVKIVIDGKMGKYKDMPLTIDGRTMLPLVAILNNLGIPNDGNSIVWNGKEKSIKITTSSTKIALKIGVKTAYVNDLPVKIDVAPMIYAKNNRTYIPVAFVATSLGKKVVWDGPLSTVLISDQGDYDKIKEILTKVKDASDKANDFKVTATMKLKMGNDSSTINAGMNMATEVDNKNKRFHSSYNVDMLGMNVLTENYYDSNVIYSKGYLTSMESKWQKETVKEDEYLKKLNVELKSVSVSVSDSVCAGLRVKEGTKENELILEGDILMKELFSNDVNGQDSDMSNQGADGITKFNMTVYIDKTTNLLNKIEMNIEGTTDYNKVILPINENFQVDYTDYDKGHEIVVPQDIKDTAEEQTDDEYSDM